MKNPIAQEIAAIMEFSGIIDGCLCATGGRGEHIDGDTTLAAVYADACGELIVVGNPQQATL